MSPIAELADELTEIMFDHEPLWPALLGLESDRSGIGDLSEEAEHAYRSALLDVADRASAVEPAGLTESDRRTRDVILSQAHGAVDALDARTVEFVVTDMFVAPASSLFTLLPMVPVGDEQQARTQL